MSTAASISRQKLEVLPKGGDMEKIELGLIRQHEKYCNYKGLIASVEYYIRDPDVFSIPTVEGLLLAQPIVVVKKNKTYHYVAGHRTFVLAAQKFGMDSAVPVQVLTRPPNQLIDQLVAIDILVGCLHCGMTKSQIGPIYLALREHSPECLATLTSIRTQKDLCAALGCTRSMLFPKKRKDRK